MWCLIGMIQIAGEGSNTMAGELRMAWVELLSKAEREQDTDFLQAEVQAGDYPLLEALSRPRAVPCARRVSHELNRLAIALDNP